MPIVFCVRYLRYFVPVGGTSFAFSRRIKRLNVIRKCSALRSHSKNIFIILRFVVGISDVHSHVVIVHFAHTINRIRHKPHSYVGIIYKQLHKTPITRGKKYQKYSGIDNRNIRAQKMHSDSDDRSRSHGAVTATTVPLSHSIGIGVAVAFALRIIIIIAFFVHITFN